MILTARNNHPSILQVACVDEHTRYRITDHLPFSSLHACLHGKNHDKSERRPPPENVEQMTEGLGARARSEAAPGPEAAATSS